MIRWLLIALALLAFMMAPCALLGQAAEPGDFAVPAGESTAVDMPSSEATDLLAPLIAAYNHKEYTVAAGLLLLLIVRLLHMTRAMSKVPKEYKKWSAGILSGLAGGATGLVANKHWGDVLLTSLIIAWLAIWQYETVGKAAEAVSRRVRKRGTS